MLCASIPRTWPLSENFDGPRKAARRCRCRRPVRAVAERLPLGRPGEQHRDPVIVGIRCDLREAVNRFLQAIIVAVNEKPNGASAFHLTGDARAEFRLRQTSRFGGDEIRGRIRRVTWPLDRVGSVCRRDRDLIAGEAKCL
jgi:hypothetical protein